MPGNAQFLTLLGEVERQLKNLNRSLDVLKQALAIDPSSAQAHYYLGLTLLDLGQSAKPSRSSRVWSRPAKSARTCI